MIYVDETRQYYTTPDHFSLWCHMMTDGDLEELHQFAKAIGLKQAWFQDKPGYPHYDLKPRKRELAVKMGAVAVTSAELLKKCARKYRNP